MADSSTMNSSDILKQIQEQTSNLETGEPTEELEAQPFEAQEEETQEQAAEQPEETSQEATQAESQPEPENEPPLRIKYKGREVEIPPEKIKEYVQKGYRYEEKVQELKTKTIPATQSEQIDFSKLDEEFVAELQKSPVKTLMQFTKTVFDSTEKERMSQRKVDRAIEKEFAANIPMWDAIREDYQDYRSEGHEPSTALKLAQGDFFTSQYFDSKQKGVEEGEKKAILKQKAKIPTGGKKGVSPTTELSEKDLRKMSSSDLAKALGLTFVKHPDW